MLFSKLKLKQYTNACSSQLAAMRQINTIHGNAATVIAEDLCTADKLARQLVGSA